MAKTATTTQWQDLASKVKARAVIGSTLSSTSLAYVNTANIVNDAVTPDKLDLAALIDVLYPVGCFFETTNTTFNPNTAWGGTWVEDTAGRVLVAKDTGTFATVGDTGGEETHTLIVAEMPAHTHLTSNSASGGKDLSLSPTNAPTHGDQNYWNFRSAGTSSSNGGDEAHNNLQPYIVVKRWHRVS